MKHLFYVHSFITYLVAKTVVQEQALAAAACVFLYGRGFRPAEAMAGILEVDVPYGHYPVNSFAVKRQFWQSWKTLTAFDAFVLSLTGGSNFVLYTNQTGIDYIRLLLTHPQCKSFSLLEEGILSYHPLQVVNTSLRPVGKSSLFYKLLLLLNYRGRLPLRKYFFDPAYHQVFAVTPVAFPGYARKVVLPSPFVNQAALSSALQHILVLDATVELGLARNESILAALAIGMQTLVRKGIQKLWVKYHPSQLENPETLKLFSRLFESFAEQLEIKILPQEICLELVAGNQRLTDVTFYVFLSSVGMYAGLAGRKVYSFAELVVQFEPEYRKNFDMLPEVYKELLIFISESPDK